VTLRFNLVKNYKFDYHYQRCAFNILMDGGKLDDLQNPSNHREEYNMKSAKSLKRLIDRRGEKLKKCFFVLLTSETTFLVKSYRFDMINLKEFYQQL